MPPNERSLAAQLDRFRADVARDFEELDRKNERREISWRALFAGLEAHLDRQDAVNGAMLQWLVWLADTMGGMSSQKFEELKDKLAAGREKLEAAIAADSAATTPNTSREEASNG